MTITEPGKPHDGASTALRWPVAACLVAIVLFAPLFFGGRVRWATTALLGGSAVAFLLAVPRTRLGFGTILGWGMVALCGWAVLSIAPLPIGVVELLSPTAVETRTIAMGGELTGRIPLSLEPAATAGALLRIGAATLTFIAACSLRGRPRAIRAVCWALAAVGIFVAGYGMYQTYSGSEHIWNHPKRYFRGDVTGTYVSRNHFGGLMAMVTPVCLAVVLTSRGRLRLVPLAGAIAMVVATFQSNSRGGVLAVCGALATLVFLGMLDKRYRRIMLIPVAVIMIGWIWFVTVGGDRLTERLAQKPGNMARPEIWRGTADMIIRFPITGSGLGSFETVFPRYQRRWYVEGIVNNAHADALEIAAEAGAPMALWLLAGVGWLVFASLRSAGRMPDRGEQLLIYGLVAGLAGATVRALVDFDFQLTGSAVIAAALAGLLSSAASPAPTRDGSPFTLIPAALVIALGGFLAWPAITPETLHKRANDRLEALDADLNRRALASAQNITKMEKPPPRLIEALRHVILSSEGDEAVTIISAALDDLRHAAQLAPASPWVHRSLARMLAYAGDPRFKEETLQHARAAATLFPYDPITLRSAALSTFRYEPDSEAAMTWLFTAFELNEGNQGYATNLRREAIIKACELGAAPGLIRRLDRSDLRAWRFMASGLLRAERVEEAAEFFDQMSELDVMKKELAPRGDGYVITARIRMNATRPSVATLLVDGRILANLVVGPAYRKIEVKTPERPKQVKFLPAVKVYDVWRVVYGDISVKDLKITPK